MRPHPGPPPSERNRREGLNRTPLIVEPTKVINVRVEAAGAEPVYVNEPTSALAALGLDRSLLNYVTMMDRPGSRFFATYLEYTFYAPGDLARMRPFQSRIVRWVDIYWNVITIPTADLARARQAANRAELLIKHGSPATIKAEGIADFPLRAANVFTLESVPGAPLYRGLTSTRLARALEDEECEEIVRDYETAWRRARLAADGN
jgi:hypothetical protein